MGRQSLYTPEPKPRIQLVEGMWYCRNLGALYGPAKTPFLAYASWLGMSEFEKWWCDKAMRTATGTTNKPISWWSRCKSTIAIIGLSMWV